MAGIDDELEKLLDSHAEYYIRQTMKFFQNEGESPALSKNNEGDLAAKTKLKALLTNQRNQLLDELLGEMPQDRPQATKQDELIPFDGDKKVEMHWLRKCQDAGFNQCRSQVIEIINAKKSKEME